MKTWWRYGLDVWPYLLASFFELRARCTGDAYMHPDDIEPDKDEADCIFEQYWAVRYGLTDA